MIEVTRRGAVTILRMAHGKANALDVELCDGLTAQLLECAQSDAANGARQATPCATPAALDRSGIPECRQSVVCRRLGFFLAGNL